MTSTPNVRGPEPTEAEIERVGRALYLRLHGGNPDWPIGIDKHGYAQEPRVATVPSWKWFYGAAATDAIRALAVAPPPPMEDVAGLVERLRGFDANSRYVIVADIRQACREAADALERLSAGAAEVARLRKALEPICSEFYQQHPLIIAARAALADTQGET